MKASSRPATNFDGRKCSLNVFLHSTCMLSTALSPVDSVTS